MKLNPKFVTHVTKGEHYMISTADTRFKGIVKNNETAAFIIECLKKDTTVSEITDKLLSEYKGVERPAVERDVERIIDRLRSIGAVEE
ncbi:MAG: PqqD family protein [Ruminococcus sp.]|nr:PqqD family protein [Ruminococcus sp.]